MSQEKDETNSTQDDTDEEDLISIDIHEEHKSLVIHEEHKSIVKGVSRLKNWIKKLYSSYNTTI